MLIERANINFCPAELSFEEKKNGLYLRNIKFQRMKKGLLAVVAMIGITSMAFAQSLEVVSYDEMTYMNSTSKNDYSAHVEIKNIGSSTVNVLCARYEYGTSSTWCAFDSTYYCWDLCYPADRDTSVGGWMIAPGATDKNFSGHAYSGTNGATCMDSVLYTFWVETNPSDRVSVVLKFSSTPTFSVAEESLQTSKAYPNPAKNFFYVELNKQPKANTTLEVYNLLGSKVISRPLYNQKVEVNVANLNSGIYVYTISENGQAVETKKIVVKN